MKNRKTRIVWLPVIVLMLAGIAMAQVDALEPDVMDVESLDMEQEPEQMPRSRMERRKCHGAPIPDLTEEQKEQIQNLRTEHMKIVLPLKNQLAEMQARLKTLSTAENEDMSQIDKTIEEMGELRILMMKEGAAHRQTIRRLLTDEQRVAFDNRPARQRGRPRRRR